MSQIRSLKDISDKEQRRKRIGGIVIITLLLLSTLGFALSFVGFGVQPTTNEEYPQGFFNNGQYWIYTASSQQYYFTYHPDELTYEPTFDKNLVDFANQQVYIDSQIEGSLQEIGSTLGRYVGRLSEACYGPCERDLPEKTCADNIIVTRNSQTELIRQEDNCIFIEGDLKTVDAFLYKTLGISQNN